MSALFYLNMQSNSAWSEVQDVDYPNEDMRANSECSEILDVDCPNKDRQVNSECSDILGVDCPNKVMQANCEWSEVDDAFEPPTPISTRTIISLDNLLFSSDDHPLNTSIPSVNRSVSVFYVLPQNWTLYPTFGWYQLCQ